MSLRPPVEKLPLVVRKSLRDNFDTKIPELQNRMSKLGFPEYKFIANANELYAYADTGYAKNKPAECFKEYFETFVKQVEQFTKEGKDVEAVESLKKAVPKNSVILLPDAAGRVSFCGCDIHDGQIRLLFQPNNLGFSVHSITDNLSQVIDAASDREGSDNVPKLPVVIRRAVVQHLDSKVPETKKKLQNILGREFRLEADVAAILAFVRGRPIDFHPTSFVRIPEYIFEYFEAAAKTLEERGFGKDGMLREAFNNAATQGVIRFEVVEKLQHNKYNDCIFEGGELKLQTTAQGLGLLTWKASDDILDRL